MTENTSKTNRSATSITCNNETPEQWALGQCFRQETHFNDLQHRYRVIALTVITGYFVGLAAILGLLKEPPPLPAANVLISALSLFVSLALGAVAALDHAYTRLLGAAFMQGLRLEMDHAEIGAIHIRMQRSLPYAGATLATAAFYFSAITFALAPAPALLLGLNLKTFRFESPTLPPTVWVLCFSAIIVAGVGLFFVGLWLLGAVGKNTAAVKQIKEWLGSDGKDRAAEIQWPR